MMLELMLHESERGSESECVRVLSVQGWLLLLLLLLLPGFCVTIARQYQSEV